MEAGYRWNKVGHVLLTVFEIVRNVCEVHSAIIVLYMFVLLFEMFHGKKLKQKT